MSKPAVILYLAAKDRTTLREVIQAPQNQQKLTRTIVGSRGLQPCLELCFHDLHANPGVVAGRSRDADIFLPHHPGIGNFHFVVTFDQQYRLVLKDTSVYGTRLCYENTSGGKKNNFTWLLHQPGAKDGDLLYLQIADRLEFYLVLVIHDPQSPSYAAQVAEFWQQTTGVTCEPSESRVLTMAPSESESPPNNSEAHVVKYIARGAFGDVRSVWDMATGEIYALKSPVLHIYQSRPDSEAAWKAEAAIMKSVEHDHIVRYIGEATVFDPAYGQVPPPEGVHPGLRFEYVMGGSLQDYTVPLSRDECLVVLDQLLKALIYLHGRTPPMCHRDIKPGNILVEYRNTDGIYVKFADFGLAKTSDDFSTTVGTVQYCAPEIYARFMNTVAEEDSTSQTPVEHLIQQRYTVKVDVYSLGLVIAEQLCGLPGSHRMYGSVWVSRVNRHITRYVSDASKPEDIRNLLHFVLVYMLERDPDGRKTAAECHKLLCDGGFLVEDS